MEERRFKVKGTRTARVDKSFSLSINIARFHWVEPHPQALLFRDLQAGSIRLVSPSPSAPASSGYDGRSFVQIPNTKLASNMYFRQARLLEPRTFLAFVRHFHYRSCFVAMLLCIALATIKPQHKSISYKACSWRDTSGIAKRAINSSHIRPAEKLCQHRSKFSRSSNFTSYLTLFVQSTKNVTHCPHSFSSLLC